MRQNISLTPAHENPLCTFDPLKDTVEHFIGGQLQAESVNQYVEQHLIEHAGRVELVTAARELLTVMQQAGCLASVRYCKSEAHGHPIPIITAQTYEGEYVLPNINSVWNPTFLEERGGVADEHRKQVIAPDDTDELNGHQRFTLRMERFPSNAPVCLALLPSSTTDAPAQAHPIFSPEAFSAALQHAATLLKNHDTKSFSYIRDEVLTPDIRQRIRGKTALFGEREIPELKDVGSAPDGSVFRLQTFVPHTDTTFPLLLALTVTNTEGTLRCATSVAQNKIQRIKSV